MDQNWSDGVGDIIEVTRGGGIGCRKTDGRRLRRDPCRSPWMWVSRMNFQTECETVSTRKATSCGNNAGAGEAMTWKTGSTRRSS